MLSIPAKRTEVTDFTKPLQKFFAKRFSPADQAHFQNDITSFQHLRSSAVAVTDALDQLGQQHLLRYNYHLSSITMRLGSYEREMNLTFSWYDAYRPSRRFTSTSFYYDWIGVVWNMASFESVRAARADRSTEEGIRVASRGFQQAAGLFGYISEHLVPKINAGISPDITQEGLRMAQEVINLTPHSHFITHLNTFSQIMLAQAQVCFYEKAVRDRKTGGMKATIICKLAAQAAKFFQSSLSFARQGAMPGTLDVSYTATLQFQSECFNGAAQYWASVIAKESALERGSGYGQEIARLTKAEESVARALEIGQKNSLSGPLVIAAAELINAIRRAKTAAINDNNTIYLEAVPNPDSLPELDGVKMVKPLDFPEYYNTEKPLFKDMTPPEVRTAFELYQMKLDALVKTQADASEAAANSARSALVAQGLPGSLEMYKAGGQLPENLWAKIERVQSLGAYPELHNKFKTLADSSTRAERGLDNILSTSLREQQQDESFRSRHPGCTESSIPRSTNLFREIRENVDQLRNALAVAKESDRTIAADLNNKAVMDDASILAMSKSEVSKLIINSNDPNFVPDLLEASGPTVDTAELERSLVELAALIERRSEFIRTWQGEVQALSSNAEPVIDQLMKKLAAAPSEKSEDTVNNLLASTYSKTSALVDFKNQQDALVAKVSGNVKQIVDVF
jgi:programmed cell death 6-interacting protein